MWETGRMGEVTSRAIQAKPPEKRKDRGYIKLCGVELEYSTYAFLTPEVEEQRYETQSHLERDDIPRGNEHHKCTGAKKSMTPRKGI